MNDRDRKDRKAEERAGPPPAVKFVFVNCEGDAVTSLEPARALGGKRDIVMYSKGTVEVRLEGDGELDGVVLSGGDWVLFSGGAVLFDAHFTLGKSVLDADILQDIAASLRRELRWDWPKDDFLIDVFLVGQAPVPEDPPAAGRWAIPFAIPAKLEAATKAPPWAKARFSELAREATRFKALIEKQCLAIGWLTLESGKISSVSSFEFVLGPIEPTGDTSQIAEAKRWASSKSKAYPGKYV